MTGSPWLPVKRLWLLCLCTLLLTACSPQYSGKAPPKVVNGEIDLTGWDFKKDGPVKLDGQWLFGWNKFIEPASWEQLKEKMPHQINLPGAWHTLKDPGSIEKKLPGVGFATYALRVSGLKAQDLLITAARPSFAASLQLYSSPGWILGKANKGRLAKEKKNEIPVSSIDLAMRVNTELLNQQKSQSYTILYKLSNHHHPRGGPWASVMIKALDHGTAAASKQKLVKTAMAGSLIILALYHLILFLNRRQDLAALYFALFTLAFFLRSFSMGIAQSLEVGHSISGFQLLSAVEYTSIPAICISLGLFIYGLIQRKPIKICVYTLLVLGSPLVCLPFFTEPLSFGQLLTVYQIFTLYTILSGFVLLSYYALKKNTIAYLILGGFLLASTGSINDILHANNTIQTAYIAPFTTILFILLQAGLISYNNAKAHREAETLAVNLQTEIKEKKELQVSNSDLENQQKKYEKMVSDLTYEFATVGEKLRQAKNDREQLDQELAEASRQLIQAEKLSSLGAMVSGIAHEISNPVNFAGAARQNLQKAVHEFNATLTEMADGDEDALAEFKARFDKINAFNSDIELGLSRVNDINVSMRNASRADTDQTEGVDLTAVVHESLIITGNKTKEFELSKNLPEDEALATCNRSQIGQVVMNFLSNAADALTDYKQQHNGHKGVIQVDLAINNQKKDQNEPKIVQISVADNGGGVPQENRAKVLDAFFTTKAAGVGTGLGLAICGKIAQAHNGSITIDDGLENGQGGCGARFTLEFPG